MTRGEGAVEISVVGDNFRITHKFNQVSQRILWLRRVLNVLIMDVS